MKTGQVIVFRPQPVYHVRNGQGALTLAEFAGRRVKLGPGADFFERVNRLRAAYMEGVERVWLTAFEDENRALLAAASGGTITEQVGSLLQELDNRYDPQVPYERTYVAVYPVFAEKIYDGLVGSAKTTRYKADPEQVEAWRLAAVQWIRTRGGSLVKKVRAFSHQTVEAIVRRIAMQAISEGWKIDRFKDALGGELTTMARYRARRIARTETMRASNLGSRAGAEASGLTLDKQWLTGPSGTGERHATGDYPGLDGQIRAMQEPYDVGGYAAMYPLDPALPPGESINCRCTEIYIPQ